MPITKRDQAVHEHAVLLAQTFRSTEIELTETLAYIDRTKLYQKFGRRDLQTYIIDLLHLSKETAYTFAAVAQKCQECPALLAGLLREKISVWTAYRIKSHLTKENAAEFIEFASTHTMQEIRREIAKKNPLKGAREKIRILSDKEAELTIIVPIETLKKIERLQSLRAQRNLPATKGAAADEAFDIALHKLDPVEKAKRSKAKTETKTWSTANTREPFSAATKHAVHLRDQGKCTHVDDNGKRCGCDRWTQIHHKVMVSEGGTNDVNNLTTLCWFHHKEIHEQMEKHSHVQTWPVHLN